MSDEMWTEVGETYDTQDDAHTAALARQAVLPLWSFLAAAISHEDFENRRALVASRLDLAAGTLAGDDLAKRTAVRAEADRQIVEDYGTMVATRDDEAARVVAIRRAAKVGARFDIPAQQPGGIGEAWDRASRPTHVVIDTTGSQVHGHDRTGAPFTAETARQFADERNALLRDGVQRYTVHSLHEASLRTAAQPAWLHERVNDPYGTSNRVKNDAGEMVDHPFWVENPPEVYKDFKLIDKDGKTYAYSTRQNHWSHHDSRDEAKAWVDRAGGLDMWASRRTAALPVMSRGSRRPFVREAADTPACPKCGSGQVIFERSQGPGAEHDGRNWWDCTNCGNNFSAPNGSKTSSQHTATIQVRPYTAQSTGQSDKQGWMLSGKHPGTGHYLKIFFENEAAARGHADKLRKSPESDIDIDWGNGEVSKGLHPYNGSLHTAAANVHTFGSTGEAYNRSQTDDNIKDGDILHVPSEGVVGYLHAAWPVAATQEHGAFHSLIDPAGGPQGEPPRVCPNCGGSGKKSPDSHNTFPNQPADDDRCWGCSGQGGSPGDPPERVAKWRASWEQAKNIARQSGYHTASLHTAGEIGPGVYDMNTSTKVEPGHRVRWEGDNANVPRSGTVTKVHNDGPYMDVEWDAPERGDSYATTRRRLPIALLDTPRWKHLGSLTRTATPPVHCYYCGNRIEQRDDPTGQRTNVWAEKDGFGDDRDFQCGVNPSPNSSQHEPEWTPAIGESYRQGSHTAARPWREVIRPEHQQAFEDAHHDGVFDPNQYTRETMRIDDERRKKTSALPRYELRHPQYGRGSRFNDLNRARSELTKSDPPGEWQIYDRHEKRMVGDGPRPGQSHMDYLQERDRESREGSLTPFETLAASALRRVAGNPHPVGSLQWFEWEAQPDPKPGGGPYASDIPGGGIPLSGPLSPEQDAWMHRRSAATSEDCTGSGKFVKGDYGASEGGVRTNAAEKKAKCPECKRNVEVTPDSGGGYLWTHRTKASLGRAYLTPVSALIAKAEDDTAQEEVVQGFEDDPPLTTKPRQKPMPMAPPSTMSAGASLDDDDDELPPDPDDPDDGIYDDYKRYSRLDPRRYLVRRRQQREARVSTPGYYVTDGDVAVAGPFPTPSEAAQHLRPNTIDVIEWRDPSQEWGTSYAQPFPNPTGYSRGRGEIGFEQAYAGGVSYLGSKNASAINDKLAEITASVLRTNPGMDPRMARNIAIETVQKFPVVAAEASYPGMLFQRGGTWYVVGPDGHTVTDKSFASQDEAAEHLRGMGGRPPSRPIIGEASLHRVAGASTPPPEGVTQENWDRAADHAGLGVGHIWTNTRCPAYRTLDPNDCTCASYDFYGRPKQSSRRTASTPPELNAYQNAGLRSYCNDRWDSGDRWGSAMDCLGGIADVLTSEGEPVIESAGYSPGMGGPDMGQDSPGVWFKEGLDAGHYNIADLQQASEVLDKLCDQLDAAGESY